MTPCELIGHKYRPRYSYSSAFLKDFIDKVVGPATIPYWAAEQLADKKYECDVCERCGKVANAPKGD